MSGRNGTDEHASCPSNALAVGWALRALEPDEELAMRTHLADCRSCRELVRETELLLGEVGRHVVQVDPPSRLRDSILAEAADTPQVRPERVAAAGPERGSSDDGPVNGPTPGRGARHTERDPRTHGRADGRGADRRWAWISTRWGLVAASLAVVAAVGVGGLVVYTGQVQQQRDAQIAQSQSLADVVTQLDRPGTTHATLSTTRGEAVAAVLTTASQRTVVTAGLPSNDRVATVYVLWGLGVGDPRPLGTFDVATPGAGVHEVGAGGAEPGGPAFPQYAISLEPGRSMPTSPTVVVASGPVQG